MPEVIKSHRSETGLVLRVKYRTRDMARFYITTPLLLGSLTLLLLMRLGETFSGVVAATVCAAVLIARVATGRRKQVKIEITRDGFIVRTGFLGFEKKQSVLTANIEQLFVGRYPPDEKGKSYYYLAAKQHAGPDLLLLSHARNVRTLLALEKQLELELDLPPAPELSLSEAGLDLAELERHVADRERNLDTLLARRWANKGAKKKAERQLEDAQEYLVRYRDRLNR